MGICINFSFTYFYNVRACTTVFHKKHFTYLETHSPTPQIHVRQENPLYILDEPHLLDNQLDM